MKKLMTALLVAGLFGALALAGCFSGGGAKGEGCEVTRIVLVSTGGDVNRLDAYVFEPDPSLTHVSLAPDNDLSHVGEESPWPEEAELSRERLPISEADWQGVVGVIGEVDFMDLPEVIKVSDLVLDAPSYYINVKTTEGSHESGGYAAGFGSDDPNERFDKLHEALNDVIAKGTLEGVA